MDIFDILSLLCGLALFLYGMDVMGNGLKKSAGRRLKTILGNLTSSRFKGFLLGLGVTAIIQSSSATSVLVVGFVNAGTMTLAQAISVCIGGNLGTAVTAWLTALNGIEGGADATAWLNYLKPDAWMPILALIGIVLLMFAKKDKHKDVASILLGFAVLMVGMSLMSDAVGGLKSDPNFAQIFMMFENPLLGVLVGLVFTVAVQSSSAAIGVLQALTVTGAITFGTAIPILLGTSIGTCVTSILSSIGANKNGKRTAVAYLYSNVFSVVFWLAFAYLAGWILKFAGVYDIFTVAHSTTIDMFGIAIVNTIYKLLAVALTLPFTSLLEKLANATVKGDDKKGDEYTMMLDDRLLDTPSVAIENAKKVAERMAALSISSLRTGIALFDNYDAKLAQEIRDIEDKVDVYEDVLGSYMVKLSSKSMSEKDSSDVTKILHIIGDFERISDHAVNLVESVEEIRDKNITFSAFAISELSVMRKAVDEILVITEKAFVETDFHLAATVEPLEELIDDIRDQIKLRHTIRLQKSLCSIELGFILSDILTNVERVSDHCSNVAGCVLDMAQNDMHLHESIRAIRADEEHFRQRYDSYKQEYELPAMSE